MIQELEYLKKFLKRNEAKFNEHHSWLGDTESGFYSTDEFDLEKLFEQIDAFGEELRSRHKMAPPMELGKKVGS